MVVIGAILVGGLVMWLQVTKPPPPEMSEGRKTEKITTALKMQGAFSGPGKVKEEDLKSVEITNENINEADEKPKGFLFDADEIAPQINIEDGAPDIFADAPPMPSPINTDEVNVAVLEDTPLNIEGGEAIKEPRSPNDAISEKIDDFTAVAGDKIKEAKKSAIDTAQTIVPEIGVETKEKLSSALDKIEEKLPETEKIIEALDPPPSSEDVKSDNNQPKDIALVSEKNLATFSAKSPDLVERLELITQRLDKMEQKISNLQMQKIPPVSVSEAPVTAKKEPTPQPKTVVKKVVKKASKPKAKKATRAKTTSKVTWQLRAAQPGKAWVSKTGQRDMQPVIVGDKLASIGRINSIEYLNNKWIVSGQYGKIVQK